jgi:tetratricopeptide (TPR) repeat protein
LNEFLKTNTTGLRYVQKYYETERHNTVPLLSEYDGLRFIFDYYFLDVAEKDFDDSTVLIASMLKTHYANVSNKMGYKNSPPEAFINYIAYEALRKKQFNKAEALFKLNIEWYPESHTAYNSYADYFLAKKDTANAIATYKISLQTDTNDITQRKIDALTRPAVSTLSTVDLQKYTGVYNLEVYNVPIVLEISNNTLWAKVPGQENDEFQLFSENVFTVKGKQGYTITFQMDGGKPKGFTSVQPNGTFKAVFKNK